MVAWSPEEKCLLVYFTSRKMKPDVISDVIRIKTKQERVSGHDGENFRNRIYTIRKEARDSGFTDPFNPVIQQWDLKLTDKWLFAQVPREKLYALVDMDDEIDKVVQEVSLPFTLYISDGVDIRSQKQGLEYFHGPHMCLTDPELDHGTGNVN